MHLISSYTDESENTGNGYDVIALKYSGISNVSRSGHRVPKPPNHNPPSLNDPTHPKIDEGVSAVKYYDGNYAPTK